MLERLITALFSRAARESVKRDIPLNNILIPTSMPIAQAVLAGHVRQIMMERTSVTIPSKNSQPEPGSGRRHVPVLIVSIRTRASCCDIWMRLDSAQSNEIRERPSRRLNFATRK